MSECKSHCLLQAKISAGEQRRNHIFYMLNMSSTTLFSNIIFVSIESYKDKYIGRLLPKLDVLCKTIKSNLI
jgi:hypothetical protein